MIIIMRRWEIVIFAVYRDGFEGKEAKDNAAFTEVAECRLTLSSSYPISLIRDSNSVSKDRIEESV